MAELTKDLAVAQTIVLITSYSFDLQGYTIEELFSLWLDRYHASWVRLATIEALYLGRYKVVSIEQILHVWSRLGSPNTHFTHEFERLICRKLPRHLVNQQESSGEKRTQAHEITSELQTNPNASDGTTTAAPDKPSFTVSKQRRDTNLQKPALPLPSDNSHQSENTEFPAEDWGANSLRAKEVRREFDSRARLAQEESASSPPSALPSPEEQAIAEEEDQLELEDRADGSHDTTYHTPIHRFTPLPDVSPLFYKLKAVAQQKLEEE